MLKNWCLSSKRYYLKWTSKPSYSSPKVFEHDLVAIRKSKVTLTLRNQQLLTRVY